MYDRQRAIAAFAALRDRHARRASATKSGTDATRARAVTALLDNVVRRRDGRTATAEADAARRDRARDAAFARWRALAACRRTRRAAAEVAADHRRRARLGAALEALYRRAAARVAARERRWHADRYAIEAHRLRALAGNKVAPGHIDRSVAASLPLLLDSCTSYYRRQGSVENSQRQIEHTTHTRPALSRALCPAAVGSL